MLPPGSLLVREGKKLHTVMSVRAEDERTMALLRKVRLPGQEEYFHKVLRRRCRSG